MGHWSFLLFKPSWHLLLLLILSPAWSKGYCCLRSSEPDSGFYQDHCPLSISFLGADMRVFSVGSQLCHIRTTYLEPPDSSSTVFLSLPSMLDISQPMYSQDVPSNGLEFLFSSHYPRPWAEPRETQVASAHSISSLWGVFFTLFLTS